jgi:hypothetical protein
MYASRMGVHNMFSNQNESEYVIINNEHNSHRAAQFNIAYEGGFLTHVGDGFFKVKRIVANNLGLVIMCDADQRMY